MGISQSGFGLSAFEFVCVNLKRAVYLVCPRTIGPFCFHFVCGGAFNAVLLVQRALAAAPAPDVAPF